DGGGGGRAPGAAWAPSGESGESQALQRAVAAEPHRLRTSAIKSMLGDACAASGMLQVIACLLAAEHDRVPPTINCEDEDPGCRVPAHVRRCSIAHPIPTPIVNSFASH